MEFTRPRGTRDFLFEEMKSRKEVENALRNIFETYNYQEIKTPLFEELSLFTVKSGEEIIDQLYNFKDKSEREIALRPEITAPVARLYLNEMQKKAKPIKLYYFGSCFRYERPQKGRFRQFWQFGCELIGAKSPEAEAEVIAMAEHALNKLEIATGEIHINHLGIIRGLFKHFNTDKDMQNQIMTLIDKGDKDLLQKQLLNEYSNSIDEDLANILIELVDLVGKDEILKNLENLLNSYNEVQEPLNEFKEFIKLLNTFDVSNYTLNLGIARGLDYYTGIVFEIYVPELKAQKQIAGGGSYNLVELFGGERVESTGFAFGFDRLMNAIELNKKEKEEKSNVDVFIAPISDDTRETSFNIAQTLRKSGIRTEIDLSRKKFKKLIAIANRLNAKYMILVGKKELDENKITLKDMNSGNQEQIAIDDVVNRIKECLKDN